LRQLEQSSKGEKNMLRSLYSGVSGLRGFQTKLDVIGNNIANVNTVGYKKSRVTFQDLMSQTTQGAMGPAGPEGARTRGGVNPMQVGTGSALSSIDVIHTQGFRETTNNPLDLQIEGDGYFMVDTPNGIAYTRAGNFYLDHEGFLVNANGYYVLNDAIDNTDVDDLSSYRIKIEDSQNNRPQSISIEKDGSIVIVTQNNVTETLTQPIGLAVFSNPAGLEKMGENLYRATENSGDPLVTQPENNTAGSLISGALEMSNVDLAEEFTEMITAQRGFQANTRIITTSDEILQELVNLKR